MKKVFVKVTIFIILYFIITSLAGLYLGVRPPRLQSEITPEMFGLDYERVEIITEDGLKLSGWYIAGENADPKTAVIVAHGYPADKGDVLPVAIGLLPDYNVLLFDFRGLGESGGRYSYAGAKEIKDMDAAINFLMNRQVERVGIWGFSMGGAIGIMSASSNSQVRAVVADSSYADLGKILPEIYKVPILRYPLASMTIFWAKLFFGIDVSEASPSKSASSSNFPIFIIHSRADRVIGFEHALLLQQSLAGNPQAKFLFPDDLLHGEAAHIFGDEIKDFFLEHL